MPATTAHRPASPPRTRRPADGDPRAATIRSKELTMSTTHYDAQDAHAHDAHEAHPHPTGWRRFVYSTNHKDIGTMYLVFALMAGVIGASLSIAWRMGVPNPGIQFFHDRS